MTLPEPVGGLDYDISLIIQRAESEMRERLEAWLDGAVAAVVAAESSQARAAVLAQVPPPPDLDGFLAGAADATVAGVLSDASSQAHAVLRAEMPTPLTDDDIAAAVARKKAVLPFHPPITKQAALTAAVATTAGTLYGTETAALINNLKTRITELESRLRSAGLLT